MSVIAAISPNETNSGRRGGCLGFLVYLFSGVHRKQDTSEGSVERYTVGEHTGKFAELGTNSLLRFFVIVTNDR